MAISRIIYTNSNIVLTVPAVTINTVQNATHTLTVPRENVNAFGFTGTVDRPQLDVTDATIEFAFIPQEAASGTLAGDMGGGEMGTLMVNSLEAAPAAAGAYTDVTAAGVGALTNALMNSAAVDGAIGAMPTTTVGFTGTNSAAANPTVAAQANTAVAGMVLTEPQHISLGGALLPNGSCAQSGAIAWDLPVELVLCLGQDPNAAGEAFGNPPGTASITVESLADELAANTGVAAYTVNIGDFNYTLAGARIDSKTNSLAVGDLFATFNYVLGGTADGMTCA